MSSHNSSSGGCCECSSNNELVKQLLSEHATSSPAVYALLLVSSWCLSTSTSDAGEEQQEQEQHLRTILDLIEACQQPQDLRPVLVSCDFSLPSHRRLLNEVSQAATKASCGSSSSSNSSRCSSSGGRSSLEVAAAPSPGLPKNWTLLPPASSFTEGGEYVQEAGSLLRCLAVTQLPALVLLDSEGHRLAVSSFPEEGSSSSSSSSRSSSSSSGSGSSRDVTWNSNNICCNKRKRPIVGGEGAYANLVHPFSRLWPQISVSYAAPALAPVVAAAAAAAAVSCYLSGLERSRSVQEDSDSNALRSFNCAVRLDPTHIDSNFNAGALLLTGGQPLLALPFIARVAELDPTDQTAHSVLGDVLFHAVPEAVVLAYRGIVERQPHNVRAKHQLAKLAGEGPIAVLGAERAYVAEVFDGLAEGFEDKLVTHLGYRVPWQLLEAVQAVGDRAAAVGDTTGGVEASSSRRPPHNWRVLDLGCGTGLCGKLWRESLIAPDMDTRVNSGVAGGGGVKGEKEDGTTEVGGERGAVMGVDLSPKMVAKARDTRAYSELLVADIHEALSRECKHWEEQQQEQQQQQQQQEEEEKEEEEPVLGPSLPVPLFGGQACEGDRGGQGRVPEGDCSRGAGLDLILSADTFIYVGDLERCFDLCQRSMRPGALFAFSVEDCDDDDAEQLMMHQQQQQQQAKAEGSGLVGVGGAAPVSPTAATTDEGISTAAAMETAVEVEAAMNCVGLGYALLQSGRYAHSLAYVERLSRGAGLIEAWREAVVVRKEHGAPIRGHVFVLQKEWQ